MRRVRLIAGGLLLAAGIAPAAGQEAAQPLCEVTPLAEILFNPDGDHASRKVLLDEIKANPAGASTYRKHLLGAMYRLGDTHPAKLLADKDVDMARRLLAHAALDGNLTALAASAELELSAGDAMAAMVWAQLYAHYAHRLYPQRYRTYQADLINRAYEKLPSGSGTSAEIEELVAGFVATYGERIEKGLETEYQLPPSGNGDCTPIYARFPTHLASDRPVPMRGHRGVRGLGARVRGPSYQTGLALYWVRVAPTGEVAEAFVVDSLPTADFSSLMMPTVKALKFNAVAEDAPMRDVLLPMSLNDHSIRLRD